MQRPVPPADREHRRHQDEGGRDGDALCRRDAGARLLLAGASIDREQIDADHRSPTRRRARPTATAAVGAMSTASDLNRLPSKATFLKGSNGSTGAAKRSPSISVKPSAREAPPLSMMR